MLLTVAQTSLIAWFGFALSGRLDMVLKERSVALQSASALAGVIKEMQSVERDNTALMAYVRKIAMYGREAIEPLTIMAAATGPYRETIPLAGLRLVAIRHKTEVCLSLSDVIAAQHLVEAARFGAIADLHKELTC